MTPALERELNRLGVIAQPKPKPEPERPVAPPNEWRGVWYPDGEIPF